MYLTFKNVSLDQHYKHMKKYDQEKDEHVDIPKNKQKTEITNIKKSKELDLQEFMRFVLDCDREIYWHFDDESRTVKAVLTCEISAEI